MATKLTFNNRELLERFRETYRDEIGLEDEIFTEAARHPCKCPGLILLLVIRQAWPAFDRTYPKT